MLESDPADYRDLYNLQKMLELGQDILSLLLVDKNFVPLAQTCKEILKLALQPRVLVPFVSSLLETAKHGQGSLPKFLYSSLPSTLVDFSFVIPNLNLTSCAVSGGHCVKSIYNLNYKSDIDLWVHPDKLFTIDNVEYTVPPECKRFAVNSQSEEYDIVVRSYECYQAISMFDLSISSVSVVYDQNGTSVPHLTPLFLYTYLTKNIVVTSLPLKDGYVLSGSAWEATANNSVKYHQYHLTKRGDWDETLPSQIPFHSCRYCSNASWCRTELMIRWRDRLRKYATRFPDHTFAHVDHPH